jgi:hypothetical protein
MLRIDISPTVPKKTVSRLHRWGQLAWQRYRKTHGTVQVRVRWQDSRRRALHVRAILVLAAPARTRVLLDVFMLPQDDLDRIKERCGVMAALRDDAQL